MCQEAGIDCEFCHRTVAKADAATVPAVEQCLICHEVIDGSQKPEINDLLALCQRKPAHQLGTGTPYAGPCAVCP